MKTNLLSAKKFNQKVLSITNNCVTIQHPLPADYKLCRWIEADVKLLQINT